MRIESSDLIPDAKLILLESFKDERGEFFETFSTLTHRFEAEANEPIAFVEDDIAITLRGTLRGMHGDHATWKLMQCLVGEVQLAFVDMRPGSATYLCAEDMTLSERERRQVLVPAGCAVGHLALSERSVISYKQSSHYSGATAQFTVRWDDPKVGISWQIQTPRLSQRDAAAALL